MAADRHPEPEELQRCADGELDSARDRIVETTDRSTDPNWILARSIVPRGYGASGYTMTHITGSSVQKV